MKSGFLAVTVLMTTVFTPVAFAQSLPATANGEAVVVGAPVPQPSVNDEFPADATPDEKEFLIKRRAEDEAMRKEIELLRKTDEQAAQLMEENYRAERLKELEEYRLERDAGLSEHRIDPAEQYDVDKPLYKDPMRRQGDINDNRRQQQ